MCNVCSISNVAKLKRKLLLYVRLKCSWYTVEKYSYVVHALSSADFMRESERTSTPKNLCTYQKGVIPG